MFKTLPRLIRRLIQAALLVSILVPGLASAQSLPGLPATESKPAEAAASEPLDPAAVDALIRILRDEKAREALISRLEGAGETTAAETARPEPGPSVTTLGGQIAEATQGAVENAAAALRDLWKDMRQIPAMFGALGQADYRVVGMLVLDLGMLVGVTYLVYWLARRVTARFRQGLNARAERAGVVAKTLAALLLLLSNILLVLLAWGIATAFALALIGAAGQMPFHHSLFLNAFLIVECAQAVVRAVLQPRRPHLRMLPIADEGAQALARWFRATLTILVFGQILLVPVFARNISVAAGQVVSVLGYIIALAMTINLVLRLRQSVSDRLTGFTSRDPGGLQHFLARYWHVPVVAYLLVLFFAVVIWPPSAIIAILLATLKVAIALALGLAAAGLLSRIIMNGVKLPPNVSSRIPLLEQRLNSFVPRALMVLRVGVMIVVIAVTLDAIGLFSVADFVESDLGGQITSSTLTVGLILFSGFLVWLVVSSWVDYRLQPAENGAVPVRARERTLLVLARNAITVTIAAMVVMFTLSEIGINIAPLLASAGVIGLAIGFGAQKLVQDIITGVFIQLEGAIDVGDVVNIGGISGTVERLTIRSASLRDVNGVYHIIPFSSVDTVSNFMRGFAFVVCDMGVGYRENIADVKSAMLDAFEELKQDEAVAPDLVGDTLEWMGVEQFGDSAVVVRARIKTLPGRQWSTKRAYNGLIKEIFDARSIEMPFPHQTIYFGEDRDGNAPPMRLKTVSETESKPRRRPRKKPSADARATPDDRSPQVPDADDFAPPDRD